MSIVLLSDALADWMDTHGATDIRLAYRDNAEGLRLWSAAIVRDNHQPGCRHYVEVLDTSDDYPTCWQPLHELANERRPVQDLEVVDWGRLG